MRRIYNVVSVCCWIYFVGVFVFFSLGGGGLAAINTQADFQHKAVEESWRAWVSVVRNQPDAPKWIQSDNAKFEESIVGYIPKVLADATVGRGRFASDRLKKNEVILLDHDPKNREYSGANWNSTVFLNFVAGTYLMNFDIASGKPAYLIDDAGVENVGKTLQEQLFKKYNADYTGQIARAVSDVKIYANRLNLYNFISSMCDIKNSKMPVPEEINAAKLPDLSNYLAPGCWTSQEFDSNAKVGRFTIQMATVTNTSLPEGQNRANWSITGLVSSGKFWGYALPNAYTPPTPDNTKFAGYALLDRDMQFSPYKEVKDYDNRESFLKNCCLSGNKVHGLSNPRGFCLVNTCFQMLHNSAQVRRIVAAFKNGDLKGRSRVVNKIAEGFALIENGNGLNVEVFKKYLKEFASEADKANGSEIYECLTKGEKITPYFLDCFVALLINECTKCGNDVLRGNFLSQNMEVVKCVECGAVAQSLDENNVFSFTDGCPNGLLNYLGKACIPDGYESGNVCSKCKQSNTEFCWQKYFYFPNILILSNMPADEENPRFFSSYPETLELTDIEGTKKYELVAQGIGNEGHSFSRIKLNDGKWITVDDAQVLTEYQVQQNGNRISVNDGRFAQDERCWGLIYEQR